MITSFQMKKRFCNLLCSFFFLLSFVFEIHPPPPPPLPRPSLSTVMLFPSLSIRVSCIPYLPYLTYLTLPTDLSLSKSRQDKTSQGKSRQVKTKKTTKFSQVILPNNLHRSGIHIHLTSNTSSLSFTLSLSSIPFRDVKGQYHLNRL